MIQRFETFITAITQISRSIQKLKSLEMADFGLKGTHVMVLFQLHQHPEGLTGAQLAHLCEEDKAAISRTVSQLAEKNLISLVENDGKRYRATVTLTKKGEQVTKEMGLKILNAVNSAAQGYTAQEREIFYRVLLQVAENLQKASSPERP